MRKLLFMPGLLLAANFLAAQECDPLTFLNQDFESATIPTIPSCTTSVNVGSGNNWATIENPGNGFDNQTLFYASNNETANAWFFTRGVNLTAGTFYKISYKYGNNSTTTTENLTVTLGTSATIAAAETFATHNVTGGIPATNTVELFNSPVTGTYYLGFHATSSANQGNLYVDDIVIEPVVCGTPTNVGVTSITQTGATLSWNPPTGSNISIFSVYQYAISETNTPPADGTYHGLTFIEVTDLDPGTTYYVFTRSLCGPVWSDWTDSVTFTTPVCDATTVPYLLDFESAVVPGVPDCTLAINAEAGNNWVTVNNPGDGFTSNTLQYADAAESANAWFFTQGIQLTSGTYYKVSYKYGNNSADTTEKLRITMGSSPSAISVTGNFQEHLAITGGTQTENAIEFFNVPTSGVYYFGFNALSEASQGSLYVDDFLIEEIECGTPSNIAIGNITDTSATITWAAPTTGNSTTISVYQYAYGTTDTPPADGTYEPGLTTSLSDLQPETTYYVFTRTQCGPVWSDWTVTSFTTDEALGTSRFTLNGISYYPNPVKDVLNINTPTAISSIEVYNITGQQVVSQNSNSRSLNLSQLAAGSYLLVVNTENGIERIKIIKQ